MWEWLGEPLAVDLANTVRRRGHEYEELLAGGEDVVTWARHERGRVPGVDPHSASERLGEIRATRDDVFALLLATVYEQRIPPAVGRRLNRRVRDCPVVHQLSDRPGALRAQLVTDVDPVDELLARASDSAIELAGAGLDAGLAFCDAPSCGQFFTRSRPNQRWCGPACGTRVRVARHAAHRSESP
jgi:predicted RNA-binding Zn ribbon-like protein